MMTSITTTRVLKLAMSRRSHGRPGLSNFLESQGLMIVTCNGGTSHNRIFQRVHLLPLLSKNFYASSSSPVPRSIQGIKNHQTNVVDLMVESEAFLLKTNLPFPIWSQEISKLFHLWHQILFKIHYKDKNTLGRCVACTDALVHAFLEKYKEDPELLDGKRNNAPFRPTEFVSTGIFAWGRVAAYNRMAPVKAEAMVAKLHQVFNMNMSQAHSARFQPTQEVYSAMTYCWSQSPFHPEAPEKSLYWMNHILEHPKMQIQAPTYNAVLRAYAKQGKIEKVRNLVTSMTVEKDVYTYQSIIEACLNSQQPQAIVEARRALQQGLQQGLRQQEVVPLTHMFGKFLNLNRDNPEVCNTILEQLQAVQEECPSIEILQARHFVIAMTAWAQKGQSAQVEKLFLLMEELYKRGSQRFRPTYQILVVVLSAFTKEGTVQALKRAESLLERIMTMFVVQLDEKVSNHAYNLILDAYSRVSGLEDRSRRISEVMVRMQRAADRHDNPGLLPDKFSYAALLRTTIAESNVDFVSKVDELFRTMEKSAHAPARPDLKIYSMILDACGKSQDVNAPVYAEELFGRLKFRYAQGDRNLRPDASIYTILMKVYSNAGDAARSESLLAVMAKEYTAGNSSCRPDEVAYRTAISAWGRSSLPESLTRAMGLFQSMKNEHDNGNIACRPTSKTILELMLVVSRSKEADKLKIGKSLLQSMGEIGIPLDQRVWNAFLSVCAKTTCDSTERQEALQTAMEVFESLRNRESMVADSGIYSSMLYAGENLIENLDEREQFQCEVFSKCAEDGKVNRPFLLTLRRLLPAGRYQSLTSLDPKVAVLDMEALPSSWQRHT